MNPKTISLFSPGKYSLQIVGLVAAATSFFITISSAQDTTSVQGKMEATLELSFHKHADLSKTAMVMATALKNDKHILANNARVSFYIQNNSGQQLLNKICTDINGAATIDLPKELPLDADRHFTITAKIEDDSLYENTEEQITYSEVNLSVQLQVGDSVNLVNAMVTETGAVGEHPAKDVEIKFYVQRLFGVLPLAEENAVTTDDAGLATFVFPKDIPGDTLGNIIVVARIEDNENYGNVESKVASTWGVPLLVDKNPFPRALWEPYAPPTLILVICVLFGSVWCTYFFMFYQLRKIKQDKIESKQQNFS